MTERTATYTVSVSYLYSGFIDYFSGHGEADNEAMLYASYGPETTLRDLVDEFVSDYHSGQSGELAPEDVTSDMVRDAIIDALSDDGRKTYEAGGLCEWAETWRAHNPDWQEGEDTDDCMDESPQVILLLSWERIEDDDEDDGEE